jgi:FkbM family methyltransferase
VTEFQRVETSRGRHIYVDASDMRGQALAASHDSVNPRSLDLWRAVIALADWATVVDVGCNYGEMLIGAELSPGARVIAFEPNPRILPFLSRTLAESGLEVDLRPVAVAAEAGVARFDMDEEWSGTSGIHLERGLGHAITTVEVPVTTLDRALEGISAGPCCLKIDVEGFEQAVLEGARQVLGSHAEWAIMIEIEHQPSETIAEWASRYTMFLLDGRADSLVRVSPDAAGIAALLESGQVHRQDAVLVSDGLLRAAEREGSGRLGWATQWLVSVEARTRVTSERDARIAALEAEIRELRASRSWRITAPVRALGSLVRRRRSS